MKTVPRRTGVFGVDAIVATGLHMFFNVELKRSFVSFFLVQLDITCSV